MKEICSFQLQNRNTYLFVNRGDFKYVMAVHPKMIRYLFGDEIKTKGCADTSDDIYYKRKAEYIKSKLPDENHSFSGRIHPSQVEEAFLNVNQIVFEVTDRCNLNCTYCGYGGLYGNYDKRESGLLKIEDIAPLFSFLDNLQQKKNKSINDIIYISFYGGEPLLNMTFIKNVVSYIRNHRKDEHKYEFSMTTNAVLLHKYMDYLAANKVHLLISLDGDEKNNSYRVFGNGENSYNILKKKIEFLKNKYPDYFNNKVLFMSVLHNRNSINEINMFLKNEYNKIVSIGPLNPLCVRKEKMALFKEMSNSESIIQEGETKQLFEKDLKNILTLYNPYAISSLIELFFKRSEKRYPTGTCIPLKKKIFISSTGLILPCEKIDFRFNYGKITNKTDEFNDIIDSVVRKHNRCLNQIKKTCKLCYYNNVCNRCIFNLQQNKYGKFICQHFSNKSDFQKCLGEFIGTVETHPNVYHNILNDFKIL